jgi:uncharacterized protein YcgI (DUF1989 family)
MTDVLSNSVTFAQEGSIYLTAGNRLWSSRGDVMAEIVSDDIACHDFLLSWSYISLDQEDLLMGSIKPVCTEGLLTEMVKQGINPPTITTPFNIFKNIKVEDVGTIVELPSVSEAGDTLVLQAVMDIKLMLLTPASKMRSGQGSDSIGYSVESSLVV